MLTSTTMKLFALLSLPLAAVAAPNPKISKRFDEVVFAPANPPQSQGYNKCLTEEHQKTSLLHTADMLDCLEIGTWASDNDGMWLLTATTNPKDDTDWHILRQAGNCAFLVKNQQPTSVGNKDVSDFIDEIHLHDDVHLLPIEMVGTFDGCQNNANVSFWLRDTNF
ncbi:hypothetical protein HD806DRAFT_497504 [Xylariaceae sp. AK1471]|nr:hypothetical protein HD806DRAFT_497504 [Xylariaceae sp. AK1471]